MTSSNPAVKRRSDYLPPDFLIDQVTLEVDLDGSDTQVVCVSKIQRQGAHDKPLVLDGIDLTLLGLKVNGEEFEDFKIEHEQLIIQGVPDEFELTVVTGMDPSANTSLEGLYLSAGAYCTQCEAEGFRKITYFLDRPDVLAEYRVTIRADKKAFPYLLANGNKISSGDLENGRHFVTWHDPFKKPCYLFALVAGDFDLLEDSFHTKSGREVALQLFVDKGMAARGPHALSSLKKAMAWDEEVFGLEYDLDIYMIVAVDFFNMGAMENKGLNVFNSKFVLADSQSATDEDYFNIESVIAHEYFHNWTGNRVTCRDWFQLSLKEGLTVFRDQQFSSDMASDIVNRIKSVRVIREHQFAEDASAMAHPIRPDEVMEMNNFYTVTVYNKGAEVIRMMHTLLGQTGFRKGMDLYFERFDGQAVTCDDFIQAMEDANDKDLSQFRRWYSQSGTPKLVASDHYDADTSTYELNFQQVNQATADQSEKQDLHIPIRLELLQRDGSVVNWTQDSDENSLFELKSKQQSIQLEGLSEKPVPVLLGGFSAPVKLDYPYQPEELTLIAQHGQDQFARWDALQTLFSQFIHARAGGDDSAPSAVDEQLILEAASRVLDVASQDPAFCAEMLTIPSFETLCQQTERFDVEKLYIARHTLLKLLASLTHRWSELYQGLTTGRYEYEQEQVSRRQLRNLALTYLCQQSGNQELAIRHYEQADNMTDSLGAIKALQRSNTELFDDLMQRFEHRWHQDPLVLDKWFGLHATTQREDILARLDLLSSHAQYSISNPNRVRALVGSFAFYNPLGFHNKDGSGYRYVTDYLMELDEINPQVSARIITPLTQWQKLDEDRQLMVKAQLARLLDKTNLSKDLYEKVSKSLNFRPN